MAPNQSPSILLTGATGYLGGTILANLLEYNRDVSVTISCLIRRADQAERLKQTYGSRVQPVLYSGLDDLETATEAASNHDIVINAGIGYDLPAARALILGLSQRKASTGRDVWMIHTSGTSNLSDQPITGLFVSEREYDDIKDNIYEIENDLQNKYEYIQRTAELGVVDAGLELGVKTVVLMPPTIFGRGQGLFKKSSTQIPAYIRTAMHHDRVVVMWEGRGKRDYAHVEDVADLYRLVLDDIVESQGKHVPTGQRGIIFTGSGTFSWMDVAQDVAKTCFEAGVIGSEEIERVSLEGGTKLFSTYLEGATKEMVELGLSGNSRTVASVAARLGWRPTRGEESWKIAVREDLDMILQKE